MGELLHVPLSTSDASHLAATVADAWAGERGAARLHGVDPRATTAHVGGTGLLYLDGAHTTAGHGVRALSYLADLLEDRGYAVDWTGGPPRVVGWAAVPCTTPADVPWEHRCELGPSGPWLVRIASLDITDPRRQAHNDALHAARLARRAPASPVAPSRGEAARQREAAKYGGGRR